MFWPVLPTAQNYGRESPYLTAHAIATPPSLPRRIKDRDDSFSAPPARRLLANPDAEAREKARLTYQIADLAFRDRATLDDDSHPPAKPLFLPRIDVGERLAGRILHHIAGGNMLGGPWRLEAAGSRPGGLDL
jgi:hypothetical protein